MAWLGKIVPLTISFNINPRVNALMDGGQRRHACAIKFTRIWLDLEFAPTDYNAVSSDDSLVFGVGCSGNITAGAA